MGALIKLSIIPPDPSAALSRRISSGALAQAAGRGISALVCERFRLRGRAQSRPGWPRSGYWADAADGVQTRVSGSSAEVEAYAPGLRLHWLGGIVRPSAGKKSLAIPARPEVAGVWPSEYDPDGSILFAVWRAGSRTGFLAEKRAGGFRIMWLLVPRTTHSPDPSVVPSEAELASAARAAAAAALRASEGGAA